MEAEENSKFWHENVSLFAHFDSTTTRLVYNRFPDWGMFSSHKNKKNLKVMK